MSGWMFLAIGVVAALADFFVGLRFSRMGADQLRRNPVGSYKSTEQLNRAGRILMIAAPLVLLVFAAIAFGFIPVGGVEPVDPNWTDAI